MVDEYKAYNSIGTHGRKTDDYAPAGAGSRRWRSHRNRATAAQLLHLFSHAHAHARAGLVLVEVRAISSAHHDASAASLSDTAAQTLFSPFSSLLLPPPPPPRARVSGFFTSSDLLFTNYRTVATEKVTLLAPFFYRSRLIPFITVQPEVSNAAYRLVVITQQGTDRTGLSISLRHFAIPPFTLERASRENPAPV